MVLYEIRSRQEKASLRRYGGGQSDRLEFRRQSGLGQTTLERPTWLDVDAQQLILGRKVKGNW